MSDAATVGFSATDPYKYDVAFSFLAQDESTATSLNDLLQDRVRTFLYSTRQEALGGTDGEQTFGAVFGEQSRFVVVLYRRGWGESPWTRIEQTAIRNRAFEHGYGFVIFVKLDSSVVPEWLPKTQIWVGFERWGLTTTAGVIESRVQELGGEVGEETVAGRAARLERQVEFSNRRHQFLHSREGIESALQEFTDLQQEIDREVAAINASGGSISFQVKTAPPQQVHQTVVMGLGKGLSVAWHHSYSNSFDDSGLYVSVWKGHPPFPGIRHLFDQPQKLAEENYTFDVFPPDRPGWVASTTTARTYSTKALAAHVLKLYLEQVGAAQDEQF